MLINYTSYSFPQFLTVVLRLKRGNLEFFAISKLSKFLQRNGELEIV